MAWDDMCGRTLVTGKAIDLQTLYGPNVDHNRRGKTGLPAAATLRNMVNQADGLRLDKGKGRGIKFHVAHCAVGGDGALTVTTKLNRFVREKPGSAVCYEDTILPIEIPEGHILVHQSVAPCLRCRSGYKAWAQERLCGVIVSADEGYDQSGDDKVFIFTPTGLVFFG
jgi:hypothetical protein